MMGAYALTEHCLVRTTLSFEDGKKDVEHAFNETTVSESHVLIHVTWYRCRWIVEQKEVH